MSKTLSVLRAVETLLGVLLALSVLTADNNNLGVLYLLVVFIALNGIFMLIGLGAAVFMPPLRRKALWVLLLPIGFVVVPVVIRSATQPIPVESLLAAAAAGLMLALTWALARPASAARLLPQGLIRSRAFNWLVIAMVVGGWLLPIGLLIAQGGIEIDTRSGQGSPGMGAAYVILLVALYLVGLGLTSGLAATWGWVAYRGAVEGAPRKLHLAQMLLGTPGLAAGVLVLVWLQSQTVA